MLSKLPQLPADNDNDSENPTESDPESDSFKSARILKKVYLRLHDACLTSEVFGSCKCDCKL